MQIAITYDNPGSLPAGFVSAVNYVVNYLDTTFSNPVTVNIHLGYGQIAGSSMSAGALGESLTFFNSFSYSTTVNALKANEPLATQQAAYATLPASTPLTGGTMWVSTAEQKALGLRGANAPSIDGYIGISSSYNFSYSTTGSVASNQYYFIGVLAHEITEIMGRSSMLGENLGNTNSYEVMDLFRYAAPGTRQLSTGGPAYFSINNGNTNLDSWNTNPSGDLGDWAASAGADSFLAFSSSGVANWITSTDLTLMNVLGWDTPPPAPNLSEYVSVSNTTVETGGSITIDAYASNLGSAPSPASMARIYLSMDSIINTADAVLATLSSSGLAASTFDHQTISVTLPVNLGPGTYYIGGIADYDHHVAESNESDNTYNVVQVIVTGPPNLSEYLSIANTTIAAGGNLTIDAYALNMGNLTSPASTAGLYLSTDNAITPSDVLLTTVSSSILGPVGHDQHTISMTLPANLTPGTYYIGGIADYNNQVAESNESDNTYNVVQLTVPGPPTPNLSEYLSVASTTVAAGGNLTIDAYALNMGNLTSPASTAGLYLSTDNAITPSDVLLATVSSSILGPVGHDQHTISVTLPANLTPGTYYIGGIADYNNQVAESNESDNTYNVVQLTVPGPPTPNLSELLSVASTTVAAGGNLTIDAYALNMGNLTSPASTAGLYLSTDNAITPSDVLLATVSSSILGPVGHDQHTISMTLPANLTPGTYYIGGIADYNNQVAESNESDNTYNVVSLSVTATPGKVAVAHSIYAGNLSLLGDYMSSYVGPSSGIFETLTVAQKPDSMTEQAIMAVPHA